MSISVRPPPHLPPCPRCEEPLTAVDPGPAPATITCANCNPAGQWTPGERDAIIRWLADGGAVRPGTVPR